MPQRCSCFVWILWWVPCFLWGVACATEPHLGGWTWQQPTHFPVPVVPGDNPMTPAKVTLGRYLFYDKRLSSDGSVACSSCHVQRYAFTDGKTTAQGMGGMLLPRNTMGLANVAYFSSYTWSNPALQTLEQQALVPLFADFPPELNLAQHTPVVLRRLADLGLYQTLFAEAFPASSEDTRFSVVHIVQALASFQRSIISGRSPYDRYLQGDRAALSPSAQRGLQLFESSRVPCRQCHAGVLFTKSVKLSVSSVGSELLEETFHNTGLYHLGGQGLYPSPNVGLFEFTKKPEDMGKFRIPSLRNVGVTAPYMHDGSVATLQEVIMHYARGGRLIPEGPLRGDGAKNPYKSPTIQAFGISPQDAEDLVAFLHSLTDQDLLANPQYSDPFAP